MKKHLLILTLLFCSALHYGFAQVTFQKAIGISYMDYANSVQQTTDGGYIATGLAHILPYDNIYLIKTSSAGNLIWTKTYVDILSNSIGGYSVQQTKDEGYIITGNALHMGAGSVPLYIIKTDAIGDTLWTKIYYQGFLRYWGYSIQQTADSGYIIAGAGSNSHTGGGPLDSLKAILVKTNQSGDITWLKAYAGIKDNAVYSVQQTNDNGYIMAGHIRNSGMDSTDVYLVKTNPKGDTIWTRTFGGTDNDYAYSVKQTSDDGYIISGSTKSFGAGGSDVYLIKTDSNGNVQWSKTYGGASDDIGYCVRQTTEDGYIISGNTNSYGTYGAYLIKTDYSGNHLWSKAIVGYDAKSVEQTDDGGYIIGGVVNTPGIDFLLLKTDSLGNAGCNEIDPATITTSPVTQLANTSIQIYNVSPQRKAPMLNIGSGGTDSTLCTSVGVNELKTSPSILVSPNPSSGDFVITFPDAIKKGTVEIYDAYGQMIFSETAFLTSRKEINLGNVPAGIYYVRVSGKENQYCEKIIIR
jgi:hypothetical protein